MSETTFQIDMTKRGWKVIRDVGLHPMLTSPSNIELVAFLKRDEGSITIRKLIGRASRLNMNLGQTQAEWLLKRAGFIKDDFQKYILVFPGTIWRASDGRRYIPLLAWDKGGWHPLTHWHSPEWYLTFASLDCSIGEDFRLVRPRG